MHNPEYWSVFGCCLSSFAEVVTAMLYSSFNGGRSDGGRLGDAVLAEGRVCEM